MFNHIKVIEYCAVIAAAASGMLEARNKKMDIVGVSVAGMITALGGGTLRDILIDRPVFWLTSNIYPVPILILAFLAMTVINPGTWNHFVVRWVMLILDAVALALYTIVGCTYAVEQHCAISVCVIMGLITGIFGGVIRDIICNQIPVVFSGTSQLYATCSFFGALTYVLLIYSSFSQNIASMSGIGVIFALRIITIIFNLKLPKKFT